MPWLLHRKDPLTFVKLESSTSSSCCHVVIHSIFVLGPGIGCGGHARVVQGGHGGQGLGPNCQRGPRPGGREALLLQKLAPSTATIQKGFEPLRNWGRRGWGVTPL